MQVRTDYNVLDLGCGAGKFTRALLEAGYSTTGTDISNDALDLARKYVPQCNFQILRSDRSIPTPDDTYTAVWISEVIEHVLDVHSFLGEINRVLKQHSLLILTTPYYGCLKDLLIITFKFDRHFDPEGSHIRFFDRNGA